MKTSRRFFLKASSGAALGVYLSPLGCESNSVVPKFPGGRFDFITAIDPSPNRANRPDASHFVQFGAEGSVQGWRYDDVEVLGPDTWQLELSGQLSNPTTLTFTDINDAIVAGEDYTVLNTLRCIIDSTSIPGLVGTALWRGVPLRRFLDAAGVDAAVRRFRIYGRDGFTNNLRREDIFVPTDEPERTPLLAFQVNGNTVPHIHGGPVRLLVPGRYGFKNLKWVDRIEATDNDEVFGSYQEVFGFFDDGTIQMATKVTDPLAQATLEPGPFDLFGYALSGAAPIRSVEVSIDDGPFVAAQLESFDDLSTQVPELSQTIQAQLGRQYPYPSVWTIFRFSWEATPGTHRLRFRAIDEDGNVQEDVDNDFTDGSDGYWDIRVQVAAA